MPTSWTNFRDPNYSINVALRINFLLPATEVAVPTAIEFKIWNSTSDSVYIGKLLDCLLQ